METRILKGTLTGSNSTASNSEKTNQETQAQRQEEK